MAQAHVQVVARTDEDGGPPDETQVVRRYRLEEPVLVRDGVRGYRTASAERVLAGDFDLFAGD